MIKVLQQLKALCSSFRKTKARINNDILYPFSLERVDLTVKIVHDFFNKIFINCLLSHCLRRSAHVHENIGNAQLSGYIKHLMISLSSGNIVDQQSTLFNGCFCYTRSERVDGDNGIRKILQDAADRSYDTMELFLFGNVLCTRSGGVASNV